MKRRYPDLALAGATLLAAVFVSRFVFRRALMCISLDKIGTLADLRSFVHRTLCEKENLVAEQFTMSEMQLRRRSRNCGLQFLLHGPRSVRLGAVWAADQNVVYFYDARGERYLKVRLKQRLLPDPLERAA